MHLSCKIKANLSVSRWSHIVEVSNTVVGLHVFPKFEWDGGEIGSGGGERWPYIIGPVGGAISDHDTSKVNVHHVISEFSLQVVLVDLPGSIWYIDSSIGLSRDEEFVSCIFWEFVVPAQESGEHILGLDHIVGRPVSI